MSVASARSRAAVFSRPGCTGRPRRSAQRAAGPNCLAAGRGSGSDALLIDAQNVLSRAGAAAAGRRRPGEGVAGSFADWLRFLAAAAQPQLMVAVFDAPAAKRAPQQQREQLAAGYLQRRRRRRQPAEAGPSGTSPASSSRPAAGDPLRPFKREVEQLGGVCLEAAPGWEADDGLAAAAAAVRQRHPGARVVVASGDGDMQQLLSPQVAWLQLHNQTSPSSPLGLELVSAADFLRRFGFPPAAYPDWLALMGKREASIGGAGVGGKAAAKLLARYGSLEAVLQAAGAGELKGWGPAAQQLLSGTGGSTSEDRAAQLRRNRRLFAANADPLVVQPRGMQQLLAALERLQPAGQLAAEGEQQLQEAWSGMLQAEQLAWQHPMHARRWRHLQQMAAEAQQQAGGGSAGNSNGSRGSRGPWQPQQAATLQGLAVDGLVVQQGGGTALFHICPCDVAGSGWVQALSVAQQTPAGSDATQALLPLLSGTMRHHVKLVQRAGYTVRLALPPPLLGGALNVV